MAVPVENEIEAGDICCPDGRPVPSSDKLAVEVSNVTVQFRSYKERPTTLKENILGAVRNGRWSAYETFDALSDVSIRVNRGEVYGIIGSNGAGKSTLLRVISGVLPPAMGTVSVRGKIDSFIQLGAGFDAELNAIENIYLNGSLHLQSREEIAERVPHILDFAELEDFATTPIKYYSSGMYARLGFSVAVDRDPDILVVDEVLAVGDERFKKKCTKVFERYLSEGKTIIMVSHSLGFLEKIAKRVMLLSKGRSVYLGEPKHAIEAYRDADYETSLKANELVS